MRLGRVLLGLVTMLYLAGIAWSFGLVVGVALSLLVLGGIILCTPFPSYLVVIRSVFSGISRKISLQDETGDGQEVLRFVGSLFALWVVLLLFHGMSMSAFPQLYRVTKFTEFLHHIFRVPATGGALVMLTGGGLVYHWIVERAAPPGRIVYHSLGAIALSFAFYFFFQSTYYEQLLIALNSSAMNY